MADISPEILARAKKVKLLLMDCDGVLTDGRLYFGATGEELRVFHVRDGKGLVDWHRAGFRSGIISGRDSPIVELRGKQLGVEFIVQNCDDKEKAFNEILIATGITADETAYIGDDVADVEVMNLAGFAIAVSDAHATAKSAADYITMTGGGLGAVRETTDLILATR